MRFDLDSFLGEPAQSLVLRTRKMEILAANIANADTPNYKAQDMDFNRALNNAMNSKNDFSMKQTHQNHQQGNSQNATQYVMYRNPEQSALDGNSVNIHVEKTEFLANAMRYQASFRFLNGRISGLRDAMQRE